MTRPLFSAAAYRGWIYAFLGAAMSLPPLTLALFATPRPWPLPLRLVGFTLALAVLVVALGSPQAARRGCVRLANRLLGTELPAPPESPASRWADRFRTAGCLAVHMALGGAVVSVTGLVVFMAVAFLAVWLGGGGSLAVFGAAVQVEPGLRGLWAPVAFAGCLALAGYIAAGGTVVLRLLAPVFLGLRPAERLAAAERQMHALAQRNRLAQELHDSIGHTLTASTIQAAVAGELMDSDPEAARRALNSIEETSRAAMDDLDQVLGALREHRPTTAPQRTLADLGPLTERVRQAGAGLSVETHGDLTQVPATVSREAYRLVQEGLTNALRHGRKTGIGLRVAALDGRLEVEVTNPVDDTVRFRPHRQQRHGHGLTGIAERVRLLGGEVSAGRMDGEGHPHWRLAARIPLRSAP
ncbi:sensor histidine kinase [Streptomyces sp. 8N114]|uniref:sensor histidine kinase n=1 Tax=Streptomyces sp. 8N114 TaxID=3457419 RepID=UPI003FD40067